MKRSSRLESPVSHPKLFLIDGTSFCYRAYYAIRALSNSKGEPTNAIYGFITMLHKLIEEQKPDYLAVCFDRREPTFRHERYKDYKAHRKPMPEELGQQMEPIKQFCRASRLAVFELAGYEADDLLGTLARRGEERFEVFIVTGDKDAMQLVNERVKILNPYKDNQIFDTAKVRERFDGLGPEKVVDIMALMGDASDNIPGVQGIGEKTALKLIQAFDSVENLLAHTDRIHSKSQRAMLEDHRDSARLSLELATIDTQVPIEISWDDLRLSGPDEDTLQAFFKRYEFRTLLKEQMATSGAKTEARQYHLIQTEEAFDAWIQQMKTVKEFSFDTETTSSDPMLAALVGVSVAWEPLVAYYIPVASKEHGASGLAIERVLTALKPILENEAQKKFGQNIKYDWIVMKRLGITLAGVSFDTMIASYLLNPLKLNHNLDDISLDWLGVKKITTKSLIGSGAKEITMAEVPVEQVAEYAAEDADCVVRLKPLLEAKLKEQKLDKLFCEVELPLAEVLAKIEMNGVYLDLKLLGELAEKAGKELEALTQEIYHEAGSEFNINSPKQLADVLFVQMKLPVIRRTKTGYSTDVNVLEKLALSHELPRKILEYRERAKLKSTYLDALPTMVNPRTELIHTSYHQTTTATGRLSSSDPNLQNIPIKTDAGRLVRKAFVPRPAFGGVKRKILAADYSQIELRVLAHLSGDPNLTKAFQEDRDIHKFTATLLYGVAEKDVTRVMRNVAKTINFSIIYGKTAFGLAQDLGISMSEADTFIENYFRRYARIKDYLESQKEKAKAQGYLTTLLGRRAYFPEIHSKNVQVRQFAERAAINAPIQGSAADLIKLAMITIQRELEKNESQGLMIMQVHDELVFDSPEPEISGLEKTVRRSMEGAYKLEVPLKVDIFTGESWYKD